MPFWLMAMFLISSNFGFRNGDFRAVTDGKAVGWEISGIGSVSSSGGRNGMPAMVIECKDGTRSFANQNLDFDPPRKGDFVVSAWVYVDEAAPASECSLWLDVLQEGADPLWGIRGFALPERKGWQQVKSVIKATHPVTAARIHLMQSGNGRARFCDVRIEELPFTIDSFRVVPGARGSLDLRGSMSDQVEWTIAAVQSGKEIWRKSGESALINEVFAAKPGLPVDVKLTASLNGRTVEQSRKVTPTDSDIPVWWIENSMTRVFQDDIPPGKPIKQARLNMARNERESFQICVRPSKPLSNVKIEVSDLTSDIGTISTSNIDWKRVGYVYVENAWPHPYAERGSKTWWPDPLLPACDFNVEAGQTQPIWVTINVPMETAPGSYKGKVTISADGMKAVIISISVEVHKAVIPVEGKMKTAFACMDAYLIKLYGGISPKLRRAYTDFLLQNKLNPDDISRTTPPDINELRYANTRGLNAFNILNVVPEREKSEVPLPDFPSLWVCYAPLGSYTPRFKQEFMARLDKIVPQLEKYGLLDKAYIYGFDERGPEYIPVIRDLFSEIKQKYPRIHTMSTCWPPPGTDPLSLNIDWYVPLSASYNPELAKRVRANGGEMGWYVCMGPKY
ncbi:MAG: glycoside hydrolase domain-containing protein, partial [Armatimonadota bacterium]